MRLVWDLLGNAFFFVSIVTLPLAMIVLLHLLVNLIRRKSGPHLLVSVSFLLSAGFLLAHIVIGLALGPGLDADDYCAMKTGVVGVDIYRDFPTLTLLCQTKDGGFMDIIPHWVGFVQGGCLILWLGFLALSIAGFTRRR